ncbi:unnamed protein product [Lymnaea stagnalis]|uniref:Uncharacterized protein n=1 Tax=Lymnaea stagnalis TaxID=6523 RepID=A0AAV2HLY4_LYMST
MPAGKDTVDKTGYEVKGYSLNQNGDAIKSDQIYGGPVSDDQQGFSKPVVPINDEEEEEEVDISCGVGSLRTKRFGTRFANLYVFAACMGVSALFSGMVHSVIHVQLTSIEKQFNIDNSKAGLFDTVSRAGHMSTILFAGHFAKVR